MKTQKFKLLKVLEILIKYSDIDNPINTNQIIAILINKYDIPSERKGIYRDIKILQQNNLDIIYNKHKKGYYINNYNFKLADVKLLTDMISASTFITETKSKELITLLFNYVSEKNCQIISKQIIYTQNKSTNENGLEIIEIILKAIDDSNIISFKYYDLNEKHEPIYRNKDYTYLPIALFYDDNKYYLIAYNQAYKNLTHFRIDKMTDVRIKEKGTSHYVNLQNYLETSFSMFSGKKENVTLKVKQDKLNIIYDKIASEILITKKVADYYEINFYIQINKIFIAWIFSNQEFIKVIKPNSLKNAMISYAKTILLEYKEEI